jgi:hypothetical protein
MLALCVIVAGCGIGTAAEAQSAPDFATEAGGSAPDVDLTALSSMMVYSEVFYMMTRPEEYLGKTVRLSGPYYATYYDPTERYIHYVLVEDATACCQSGLEFVWEGEHAYPEDYPPDETPVEITGVYEEYQEEGETYYRLKVQEMNILS